MIPYGSLNPQSGPKQWDGKIDYYNPDHNPSYSPRIIVEQDNSIYMILSVKYLGVIVFRCSAVDDQFYGTAIFNEHEIHTGTLEEL